MDKLLWIDLEMTGLDVEKEVVIECAAVVSDMDFKTLETYHSIVKQDQKYLDAMDSWNKKHHAASGLTAQIPNGRAPELVEQDLLALIDRHFKKETESNFKRDDKPIMAGNSIAQDRLFIDKYFKKLSTRLHYRMLDVSSWKVVMINKFKKKYEKKNTHRAVEDINESMAELKYYLSFMKV